MPGQLLLVHRGEDSPVLLILSPERKTILRAKDKQRHVEQPVFSVGDKDGKGTVPCGCSVKEERESGPH